MKASKRVKNRFEIKNLDSKFYTELEIFKKKNTRRHEQYEQERFPPSAALSFYLLVIFFLEVACIE